MKLYRFFLRSLSEELIFLIRLMQCFNQNIERYKDSKFLRKINSLLVFLLHKRIFRKFACDITPSCKLGNVVFRHPTGIVIGGGAALVEAYKELKPVLKNDNVDVQKGINIVMEALLSPICQIAENAGYNSEDIVDMQKSAAKNQGFDAKNGEWVDMFDKGIIDPTKVTRSALLNAASISALFITTEAGVAEIKSETPEAPMMPNQMY